MNILWIVLIFLGSVLAHELGHVVVARACGWRMVRMETHTCGGLGVGFETNGRGDCIWKVALGGLFVSMILTLLFALWVPNIYAVVGVVVNGAMLFVNLAPFSTSDGAQILHWWRTR